MPKEGLTFIGLESAGAANSTTFIGLEAAGPASSTVESSSRPSSPPQQLLLPYTTVASYTRTLPAIVSNPQPTANSAKAPVSRPGSGPGHLSHESAVSQEPTSGPEKSAAPRVTVQSLVSSTSLEVRALADVSLSVSQLREFWEQHHRYSFRNSYLDHVVRSITVQRIQRLPAAFEPMAALFPFVKLPKRSSLNNLLQQRPLLMLAILTVTSYESSSLQYALADVFRNVALARIGECEKSLDLVQGLLVFMAWNHHYMEPRKMIIHTLLGACSGSLIDLEVHSTQPQSSDEVRAYLGCYYLTCCLAMFSSERYRFPPCADFMVDQAYDLASKAEYESDKMLPGLIQMCQFLRDIGDSLQNAAPYKVHTLESIIRTTNHRWDSVKLEICSPLKHCREYARPANLGGIVTDKVQLWFEDCLLPLRFTMQDRSCLCLWSDMTRYHRAHIVLKHYEVASRVAKPY